MDLMNAAILAVAVLCAVMLVATLVQIHGLRGRIADLTAKSKAAGSGSSASRPPPALDERLAAIEGGLKDVLAALGRLDRAIRAERLEGRRSDRPEAAVPQPLPGTRSRDHDSAEPSRGTVFRGETAEASSVPPAQAGPRDVPPERGVEQSTALVNSVEAYRELIARPRKSEIARWFEDFGGLPCEATDDGIFQLVERGDGARLMLLPLTDAFALVLPSALMVVDFPTSFADVLSARAAVRQTFDLDADGSGMLRLVKPALAMLIDGVWRLKTSGRLAGLANG